MIRHYIKIAFRNIRKYKVQSVINVVGLAIGLVCFAYGYNWYQYETSYDGFYPKSKQIYLLSGIDKRTGKLTKELPLILSRKLKSYYPEIPETTHLYPNYGSTFTIEGKYAGNIREQFVDEGFFSFFPQKVLCGREVNQLKSLDEIVVTRSFAEKYFQSAENALGKVIRNGYREVLTIVSVIEDTPFNSQFKADVYELDQFVTEYEKSRSEENQWGVSEVEIYLMIDKKINIKAFEKKISDYMTSRKYNDIELKLVALPDIRHTFGTDLSFNMAYIRTFILVTFLLLLCVFFNFINLLLNRFRRRLKEMKLRTAVGAGRKELILQLVIEITISVVMAFFIACCCFEISNSFFERTFATVIVKQQLIKDFLWISLTGWVLIVLVCIPFLFSFIKSSNLVISDKQMPRRRELFRRAGLTFQIGICVCFLFSTLIIRQQISYMDQKDLGFNREGLLYIQIDARDREVVTREIATLSILQSFSPGGSFRLQHDPFVNNKTRWDGQPLDYRPNFQPLFVGAGFEETLGLTLLQGRFVKETDVLPGKSRRRFGTKAVINEEAARIMEMTDPVGKSIYIWDFTTHDDGTYGEAELEIVGVVKDFRSSSFRNPIYPVVIVCDGSKWYSYTYFARVTPGNEQAAIKEIRKVFDKHKEEGEAESPIQTIDEMLYELSTSERSSLQLFTLLATICLLISVFGIYSISYSNMEQRRKEVAVRKVMGASIGTIVGMFFREYMAIVIIANTVFLPIGWLFMNRWLEQYPHHVTVSAGLFILVVLISVALIGITILYQTLRAAKADPAKVIKNE